MGLGREVEQRPPELRERRRAIDLFSDLLASPTVEADWQSFFERHPYVLTESLPLRLDGLFSQVPLLSGVPDFVFYRHTDPSKLVGDFGVIELKRPDQAVVGQYSSKILVPSKHVRVAQQEVTQHLRALRAGQFRSSSQVVACGNRSYAFIIIGRTADILRRCADEAKRLQFRELLPAGMQLFTYDELLGIFRSATPPVLQVLMVDAVSSLAFVEAIVRVVNRQGLHARPAASIVKMASRFASEITLGRDDIEINGKSLMGVMMLAAEQGASVRLCATGPDAAEAIGALRALFAGGFEQAYA